MSVNRRIAGMQLDACAGDSEYRRIGDVVHAGPIDRIDDRQAMDVARDAGAVQALVVVFMGRRRENEKGDGEYRSPPL